MCSIHTRHRKLYKSLTGETSWEEDTLGPGQEDNIKIDYVDVNWIGLEQSALWVFVVAMKSLRN